MKKFSVDLRPLKYLGWFAPVLIIIGVTAGVVADSWGALPLGFIIAGLLLLVVWLLAEWRSLPGLWGKRSTQASTNAVVATLAVLVIIGLVNVLAVRYVNRVDLTDNKLFTLAPQTQEVLNSLEQPAKIWIFATGEAERNPFDQELLNNYRRESSNFSYEYVDPQLEPGIAREFGVQTLGDVYLEIAGNRRVIQTISPQERLSERQLTNALLQAGSDRQSVVYFLQGHGERPLEEGQGGLADVRRLLEDENYRVEPLNLTVSAEIPSDADVVIVAGPRRPLLEGEVESLQSYLENQSGLMLLLDPDTEPGLDPLLENWGVILDNLLVIDPTGQALGLGLTTPLVQNYGEHPITQDFSGGISFFPESQVVELGEGQSDIETAPLLITNEQTQAVEIPESGEIQLDTADIDVTGSVVLGVALNRPIDDPTAAAEETESSPEESTLDEVSEDAPDPESRLVVIGNSSFIVNGLVNQQLNSDVFLNSVAWLSQQEEQALSIRPKEVTNRRLTLNTQQWIIISLSAVVILPIIGIGGAIALWLQRR
ncbi:MAG: Gldg family protein [Leptolyngbyaceae bacterium]|nr:Gldg family protein [Leptolyngbyaceae bacterium]